MGKKLHPTYSNVYRCPEDLQIYVFAGGLKTGPIFKRFADMCDKRTRWIHCYLQYFVHFQCSLHGHADSQIFIANLRQKKSSNFQNMHFVRVSFTFCQKNVQIVFSFSTCQIVRVGWGGGVGREG